MEKLNPYEYLSYALRNEPDPAMVNVIEYYAEHADFFRVILGPKGDPAFAVQIKEFLQTQHRDAAVSQQHCYDDNQYPWQRSKAVVWH